MEQINHIYQYYQQIREGSVVVGEWIKRLYAYIIKGLDSKAFSFDQKKANKAIEWIEEHCRHTEGELAPSRLKLELWQKATISLIFGIMDERGKRLFREVALIVARKNGKSLFASAVANYMFFVDGGFGARIYCLAPKLDQAEIIYNDIWTMIQLDKDLLQTKDDLETPNRARHRMTDLYIQSSNSTVKKIAFSAKKSDGFNPSLTICDEIASWSGDQGLKQYEVMKSGMGARPEGLLLSCSTSGYQNDSIYDEIVKRGTAFLLGNSRERRLLPIFYMIDDPDKWNDINELRKSNPNLGVSVSVDYLLEEIAVAEQSLSKKAEFLTKYCNVKQNSSQAWLNTQDVARCFSGRPVRPEDFNRCYAVGGIDLSQTTDLTAAVCVIEKEGRLNVLAHFWMPAERIEEASARDGVPYGIYVQKGFLSPSGDNFVDYRDCEKWFTDLVEQHKIYSLKVGYDRYSASYLVQDMSAYGFNMDDVYQGFNLTPVINELDGMIRDGVMEFGDNDLLKIHLLNSALKLDNETNKKKLIKISAKQRIDGMAALLDAMTVRQKWYSEIGVQLQNTKR